jgi:hypothetical protein
MKLIRVPGATSAIFAAVLPLGLVGCGGTPALDAGPSSSAGPTSAPATSTRATAQTTASVAPQPIRSDQRLEFFISLARDALERSCFDQYQAISAQCTLDASYAQRHLEDMLAQLPDEYPQTRAATEEAVGDLEHWWKECISTDAGSVARRECIVYLPRPVQLLSIEMAWHQERRDMGLGE